MDRQWWRVRDSNPGPADYDTRYNETSSSVFKRLRQDLKTPQTQPREIRPKPALNLVPGQSWAAVESAFFDGSILTMPVVGLADFDVVSHSFR